MTTTCLYSVMHTVFLSKPSRTIKLLMMVFFIPILTVGQEALVKWDAATSSRINPTYVSSNVTSDEIKVNGGVSLSYTSYDSANTFFQTGGWPNPQQNAGQYDPNKYIQFSIKPNTDYKAELTSFTFQCKLEGGSGNFRVKYSTDATFATGVKDLILATASPSSWTTYSANFSEEINPVLNSKTVYIRIYSYNTYNNFQIQTGTNPTNSVPTIKGILSSFDSTKILAINDYVSTKKGLCVNINALSNDVNKVNVTSLVLSAAPLATEGTAIINPDKTITFNPAESFIGTSVFSYTISSATQSSVATIKVTVADITDENLSLWNGASNSLNPIVATSVNSNAAITAVGASLNYVNNTFPNTFFQTGNWPSSATIDFNKYVQFKITPDANHQLNLKQFNFVYRGGGGKFQVRYSTDPAFVTGVKTLINETTYNSSAWVTSNNTIASDINPILSEQTVYIRFYVYNTYNAFEIYNGNGNNEGPVITGTVKDISTLTANNDSVTTPSNTAVVVPVLLNDIGTSTIQSITVTQPANGSVVVNGTTAVIFTPASGFGGATSFVYILYNGSSYSSATVRVVVNESLSNSWNGASWSNGAPNSSQALTFNGDYPPAIDPNEDIIGCSVIVSSGSNVTIKSGRTLTITNEVTVSDAGTLTFENNSSLVQENDAAVNSGNINYQRITPTLVDTDYTYWSSPVKDHTMNISPDYNGGHFYSYSFIKNDWVGADLTSPMLPGNGYIMRGQKADGTFKYTIKGVFTGVPNNGLITVDVGAATAGNSILLGNPYPSALDAESFLDANAGVIKGTIYFWTHNTRINWTSSASFGIYSSSDYAAYNSVGGVATAGSGVDAPSGATALTSAPIPSGKIAAGQGFLGTIDYPFTGSTSIKYNNSMRLGGNNNAQFYKINTSKKKKGNSVEKHRIWLNLTNTQGAFKQMLIGYVTHATNGYENRFDGESPEGNDFIDFYSIIQDKNLVIQGRALPFVETDEVPLGYKTIIPGVFSIDIQQMDGFFTTRAVYLEDKLTNTVVDLKKNTYRFTTAAGTFNNRFVLRYTDESLNAKDFDEPTKRVTVSVKNKELKINSATEVVENVMVYDLLGRQIYQKVKVNSNEILLSNLTTEKQVLLVEIRLQNGKTVAKKVIY